MTALFIAFWAGFIGGITFITWTNSHARSTDEPENITAMRKKVMKLGTLGTGVLFIAAISVELYP